MLADLRLGGFHSLWLTVLVSLLPLGGLAAEGPARPNLVIVLVDDMGVMDTSVPLLPDAHGQPQRHPLNDFYRTPQMERLARRGVRFGSFYAMSVCSPTRVSLLTGQNAARHHTTNWIQPDQNNRGPSGPPDWNWQGLTRRSVTLPALLRGAGYRTIHIGKGHLGPRGSEGADPRNVGFDITVGGSSIGQPGSYYGQQAYGNAAKKVTHGVPHLEPYHGTETFLTEALTQQALQHVSDAVRTQHPFFLYFAHYAVHAPFQSDPRFAAHYVNSGRPAAAQAFATLIEGMDKSLGDLLDHLEKLGVAENTLVVFLGDNGSDAPLGGPHDVASSAPLRGRKGSHYEGGMRVPCLAAWAQPAPQHPAQQRLPIPADRYQTQFATVYDWFPTLLTLADVPLPTGHVVDGQRLDRLLAGQSDPAHRSEFLMHYPHAPHRSDYFTVFRQEDWKVVYHYFPTANSAHGHYQLFQLRDDPYESTNLAATRPAELQRLMRELTASLERHAAQYPVEADGTTPRRPQLP
ncbi:MAG: sulfatase-like hydrolase/transferase [Pirellulales bacterium]